MGESRNIIVRLPNWIGDTVMSTPFLHIAREVFPRDRITVAGRKRVTDLLLHFPGLDDIMVLDEGGGSSFFSEIKRVREGRYDLGFLLTNSFKSALAFYLGGVGQRVGYALDARRLLLNRPMEATDKILQLPMVEYYTRLLSEFKEVPASELRMALYPSEGESAEANRLLREAGWDGESRLVGINPFAHQWITKRWLPERFAKVTDELIRQYGVQCAFVSVERDRPLFEEIRGMCSEPLLDLVGSVPLPVAPAVLEHYSLFVTNDSGLMHVAAAMGVAVVGIFGPTDFRRTAPFTEKAVLIRKPQDHKPCMKPTCCRGFSCMMDISVDEVLEAASSYLSSGEDYA